MKKKWQITLVIILISFTIGNFWIKIVDSSPDLATFTITQTTPNTRLKTSELITSSLLTNTPAKFDLPTALQLRQKLIQEMLKEAEKFQYTPCGTGTLCYLTVHKYDRAIDKIDRVITSLGNKNLIWQNGIDGLINPLTNSQGTLAKYQYNRNVKNDYFRNRSLLHGKLITAKLATATANQSSPRAILTMGGPGSGKSTVLKIFGICDRDFVNIDADEFKQELVEYQVAIVAKDRLAASRVHEESSLLAKQTRTESIKTHRHVCLDGTLANKQKAFALIEQLKQNGYEVTIIGALIPYQTALARIEQRAEMTGRFIPPKFVKQAYLNLAKNAEAIAQKADFGYLYDTDVPLGKPPQLIGLAINGKYHFKNETKLKQLRSPQL